MGEVPHTLQPQYSEVVRKYCEFETILDYSRVFQKNNKVKFKKIKKVENVYVYCLSKVKPNFLI